MKGKAVIIASMRTGSTVLIKALETHSDVDTREELLTALHKENENNWGNNKLYIETIERNLKKGMEIFKVMYGHITVELWDYFLDNNWKLIHLIRKDIVRQAVSLVKAQVTDKWSSKDKNAKQTVELPKDKIEHYIKYFKDKQEEWIPKLNKVPSLDLCYEDLVEQEGKEADQIYEPTARQICQFLGINYQPLKIPIKKQTYYNLEKSIANYNEVKNLLK